MAETADPKVDLDEMRGLLSALPARAQDAVLAWRKRDAGLAKPRGGLGGLEDAGPWLAGWSGRAVPKLDRPRLAVFAAAHGLAERLPGGANPGAVNAEIERIRAGVAPITALCAAADIELRLYELALDRPSGDIAEGPAMDEADAARAMAYGMMAVEEGVDLIALGDLSVGAGLAAAALGRALGALDDGQLTALGTVAGRLAGDAAARAADRRADPFALLARLGGYDIAAMTGALIAARMGRVPVLLDGPAALAAALVVARQGDGGVDFCRLGQAPADPVSAALARAAGLTPAVPAPLDMRLGAGAGAVPAIAWLKLAVAVHADTGAATPAGTA